MLNRLDRDYPKRQYCCLFSVLALFFVGSFCQWAPYMCIFATSISLFMSFSVNLTYTQFVMIHISASCSICPSGSPVTLIDRPISIPGLTMVQTCGDVEHLFANATGASECDLFSSSVTTVCGCSVLEDEPSHICSGGTLENASREIPFLAFLFGGVVPTCDYFDAYLQRSLPASDNMCLGAASFWADYCGCSNNGENDERSPKCSTCPGAGNISTDPDMPVSILKLAVSWMKPLPQP